jgi:hypothetical protein
VYCAHKQNTFQTVHQKCVLCTQTEHFPGGTHVAVFTDHKTNLNNETQLFTVTHITNICSKHQLKATYKLHTVGTNLCIAFNLCYVHMLVLRMMADVMQVMNNIKLGIYSFYVPHNLTVGFLRHCAL